MRTAATLLLVLLPACALAQGIPPYDSSAWLASPQPVSLFCDPVGGGRPLTQARALDTPYGSWVDATIMVELLDGWGDPVAGYPAEDVWLTVTGGSLALCDGGARADGPTDAGGRTTFSGPIRAGGHLVQAVDDRLLVETAHGIIHFSNLGGLSLTSPDLDGDLDVDLSDVILFAHAFLDHGTYAPALDFHYDGVINLSDLVLLTQHRNLACTR